MKLHLTLALALLAAAPAALRAAGGLALQAACERELARLPAEAVAADLGTGALLAEVRPTGWQERELPGGSLVKVFLYLLAGGARPAALAEVAGCPASGPLESSADTCWFKPGHGVLGFGRGLAHSCQRFSSLLARGLDPGPFRERLRLCGLGVGGGTPAGRREKELELTGHSTSIRATPRRWLAALGCCVNGGCLFELAPGRGRLLRRVTWDARVSRAVLEGLRLTAAEGTARSARLRGALAKTGTAPILAADGRVEPNRTQGWAFVVVAPDSRAPVGLLVHLAPGTGSEAAGLAGRIVRRWRAESP